MMGVKKMGYHCSVEGCTARCKKGGTCTFYSFPRDENLRQLWEKSIGRQHFVSTRNSRICSKHFELRFFLTNEETGHTWLRPDAVPSLFIVPGHQPKTVAPKKVLSNKYEKYLATVADQVKRKKESSKTKEISAIYPVELVEAEKGLKICEVYSANHPAELVESKEEINFSEECSASRPVESTKEVNSPTECSTSHPVEQIESIKERNFSGECSISYPTEQVETIKEIDFSEEFSASNIPRILYKPQGKRHSCVGDFNKEDMNSPEKAQKVLILATRLELENEEIKRKYRLLEKKVASLEDVIWKMQKGSKFAAPVQPTGVPSSGEGNPTPEKQTTIPLEPIVGVKKEPSDVHPTPSTSKDTDKNEYILPHAHSSWTIPNSAVESHNSSIDNRFTNELVSDGGQLKKKQRTDSSVSTSVSDSSVVSNHTAIKPAIVLISNLSSSSDHPKNQFVGFGNYVADKLNCLDKQSALRAQKAIENILLEAEMGKYLDDEMQDIKPSIVPF